MNAKVQAMVTLADFLGEALGSSTEVVVHDLSRPEGSVVKIVNGHVSGRNVGAPATEFARALAEKYADSDLNYVSDYVCKTVDGRPLQGSTLFIRDEGRIVGLLCVNIDPKPFRDLEDALKCFMEAYRHGGSEECRESNLDVIRSAYSASSVETLSIGPADAGVAEQVGGQQRGTHDTARASGRVPHQGRRGGRGGRAAYLGSERLSLPAKDSPGEFLAARAGPVWEYSKLPVAQDLGGRSSWGFIAPTACSASSR